MDLEPKISTPCILFRSFNYASCHVQFYNLLYVVQSGSPDIQGESFNMKQERKCGNFQGEQTFPYLDNSQYLLNI